MTLGAIDNCDRVPKGRREMALNDDRKASMASDRVPGKSSKRGSGCSRGGLKSEVESGGADWFEIYLVISALRRLQSLSNAGLRTPFTSEPSLKKEHSA